MMEFKDWITSKFLEFEKRTGNRRTITEFAAHIGVSQSVCSSWMNGSRTPASQKSIERLVSVFGPEVYEIVGKTSTAFYYDPISEAPPEIKSRFSAAIAEANQQYRAAADSGIELSEAQASRILAESMAKYGFTTTSTTPNHPPNS